MYFFTRVGKITTCLKFNFYVSSLADNMLRSPSIMEKGLSYFACREKMFLGLLVVFFLRVSWVRDVKGKYILQITSTLISRGSSLG